MPCESLCYQVCAWALGASRPELKEMWVQLAWVSLTFTSSQPEHHHRRCARVTQPNVKMKICKMASRSVIRMRVNVVWKKENSLVNDENKTKSKQNVGPNERKFNDLNLKQSKTKIKREQNKTNL